MTHFIVISTVNISQIYLFKITLFSHYCTAHSGLFIVTFIITVWLKQPKSLLNQRVLICKQKVVKTTIYYCWNYYFCYVY